MSQPPRDDRVVILLDPEGLIVTLEKFHAQQTAAGKMTISLRTLQKAAERGDLPGAHKLKGSRMIWVNVLVWLQTQGQWAQSHPETVDSNRPDPPPKPTKGKRGRPEEPKEFETWRGLEDYLSHN